MGITTIKKEVEKSMILRLTFDGAFQRANIYKGNVKPMQKKEFKNSMAALLAKYLKQIEKRKRYDDKEHYKTLVKFSNEVTRKHSHILSGSKMRIGNAQKFINLYWKVCWVLKNGTPKPIHCPFDSIIMKILPRKVRIPWTKFDTIDEYEALVNAANLIISSNQSIAEWELEMYQKSNNYNS